MAYTLQQLSDIEDIKLVKHRYFRGMDTAEWSLVEGLFTDDVTVDYRGGGYRVQSSGKYEIMTFLKNSFHSDAVAMHHGNMPEITLTGDDAKKFRDQVTYGKPKKAASESLARGVELSRQMQQNGGKLTIRSCPPTWCSRMLARRPRSALPIAP